MFEVVGQIKPTVNKIIIGQDLYMEYLDESARYHANKITPLFEQIYNAVPFWFFEKAKDLNLRLYFDLILRQFTFFQKFDFWHFDGQGEQPIKHLLKPVDMLICNVSDKVGGVSNTQFLPNFHESIVPEYTNFNWERFNSEVIAQTQESDIVNTEDGQILHYDSATVHRRQSVRTPGFRLFFRLSMFKI